MGQPERRDHANGVAPTGDALLARSDRATFMPAWRCLRHSSGFTIDLRASPNNADRVRVTAIGLRPGRNRWGVVQPLVGPGPYDEAQRQRVPLRPRPIAVSRDPAPGEHGHLSLLRPEPPAAAASMVASAPSSSRPLARSPRTHSDYDTRRAVIACSRQKPGEGPGAPQPHAAHSALPKARAA